MGCRKESVESGWLQIPGNKVLIDAYGKKGVI
jgi:hypothetical protein